MDATGEMLPSIRRLGVFHKTTGSIIFFILLPLFTIERAFA